jgi:hypothetical protein
LGSFSNRPISHLQTSPIDFTTKGRLRLAHSSFPEGSSINDFIDLDIWQDKYTSFDNVFEMTASCRKSAKILKMDVSQAFRLYIKFEGVFVFR